MPQDDSMRPYVQIAAFCKTVLREANGNLSIIRIVDRHPVMGTTEEMQPTSVSLTLAIVLKSGNMQGTSTMSIVTVDPNGNRLPEIKTPVLFEGMERGVGLVTELGFLVSQHGLYWFEVLIDGVELTRIPLRILYQQGQQIQVGQPPTS